MKQFTAYVIGASLVAATGAFAQSSVGGDRFYITGYGELGYFDSSSTDGGLYRIDTDMGFAPLSGANGIGFGFNLGIDAYGVSGNDNSALYPAIELATGIGKFSLGVPRSVLDRGYLPEHKFANNTSVDLEIHTVEASLSGSFYLYNSEQIYGLRYDGSFGNTKVGASYHYIDAPSGGVDSFAIAANHTFAGPSSMVDFMLYGGAEHLSSTTSNITKYRIGAEGYWDKVTAGISYSDWNGTSETALTTAYLDYNILDNLTLTGSLGHIKSGGGLNVYGIGVQYDFLAKAYVKASVVDTDSSGSNPFYEVMVGWRF